MNASDTGGAEVPLVADTLNATAEKSEPRDAISSKEKRKLYVALAALNWTIFMQGWNDGTSGPMLPALQRHYKISYTVLSLVFVLNCVGFISAAVSNLYLSRKYGFGKTLVIGSLSQLFAYCLQSSAPPFPVFAFAYVFSGFGVAIQNALAIDFVARLNERSATQMGIMHGVYGVGALAAPLVATHFAAIPRWSFHFLVSVAGAVINIVCLAVVFKFKHMDSPCFSVAALRCDLTILVEITSAILVKAGQPPREKSDSQQNHYMQLLKIKVVHLTALFLFLYVGVEIALGGWIVTFVMVERGGGDSSGYLSTGYFGGLTLGSVGLLWLNELVGERRVVWLYIFLSIVFEITIWAVPSLIENAIAISFVGIFFGPVFPIMMNKMGRMVPHWLMSGSVGMVQCIGQIGGALLPFIVGLMSSKFGVWSLHPLMIGALVVMIGVWALIPPDPQSTSLASPDI